VKQLQQKIVQMFEYGERKAQKHLIDSTISINIFTIVTQTKGTILVSAKITLLLENGIKQVTRSVTAPKSD